MERVESDLYISVEYTGTLKNGDVFDTSSGRQPLEVKMGSGQLIRGFENELMGMALNEKKSFTLKPEEAYGERDENLMHNIPRSNVPPNMNPEEGQMVGLQTQDGRQVPARIVSVDDDKIVLDMNHPLAGQTLNFDIEVVGISDTPTQVQDGCGGGCDCSSDGDCSSGCC